MQIFKIYSFKDFFKEITYSANNKKMQCIITFRSYNSTTYFKIKGKQDTSYTYTAS